MSFVFQLQQTLQTRSNAMLTKHFFTRIALVLTALVLWSVSPILAQEHPAEHPKAKAEHPKETTLDPVKVAPDKCKVLLENDRVRVLDFVLKPGDKLAMHSHPAAIVYSLSASKIKTILPDGKATETEFKAGQVGWSEAVTHANENVGTTEAHVMVIEMKEPTKKQEMKQ
jgi:quercetin dioxygenase-like cupin family protein